jgi:hypothetical protein
VGKLSSAFVACGCMSVLAVRRVAGRRRPVGPPEGGRTGQSSKHRPAERGGRRACHCTAYGYITATDGFHSSTNGPHSRAARSRRSQHPPTLSCATRARLFPPREETPRSVQDRPQISMLALPAVHRKGACALLEFCIQCCVTRHRRATTRPPGRPAPAADPRHVGALATAWLLLLGREEHRVVSGGQAPDLRLRDPAGVGDKSRRSGRTAASAPRGAPPAPLPAARGARSRAARRARRHCSERSSVRSTSPRP